MKLKRKHLEQLDMCKKNQCPACGSDQVEGGETTIMPGSAKQDVNCASCDVEWCEYYTLESFSFYGKSRAQ